MPISYAQYTNKLTDCVLNYFISIYNRLEGRAGIVFMSTDYIKRRVDNGLRYNKKAHIFAMLFSSGWQRKYQLLD